MYKTSGESIRVQNLHLKKKFGETAFNTFLEHSIDRSIFRFSFLPFWPVLPSALEFRSFYFTYMASCLYPCVVPEAVECQHRPQVFASILTTKMKCLQRTQVRNLTLCECVFVLKFSRRYTLNFYHKQLILMKRPF